MRGLRVILTGTSNQFLWPRLPVAGFLTVNELAVDGRIISASFQVDEGNGILSAPVDVPGAVFFSDTGTGAAHTGAAHAHVAENHLVQAATIHADRLRQPDAGPDVWGLTAAERIALHLQFAEVHAQVATATTVGALLVVTPARQHKGVEAEATAWGDQLTAALPASPNSRRAGS